MKEKFIIRPMELTDLDECTKMARESFGADYPDAQFDSMKEEFKMSFAKTGWDKPNYYVCTCNDEIVGMGGFVLSWLDWDTFEMFWLSVKNGWKGKGIGTMLQKHREQEILKKSAFKEDITILFSATKTVVDFHKKNGYEVILEKASGKEVLMGKTFLKDALEKQDKPKAKNKPKWTKDDMLGIGPKMTCWALYQRIQHIKAAKFIMT